MKKKVKEPEITEVKIIKEENEKVKIFKQASKDGFKCILDNGILMFGVETEDDIERIREWVNAHYLYSWGITSLSKLKSGGIFNAKNKEVSLVQDETESNADSDV